MRIIVITEEDEFYLPLSVSYILSNCKHEVIGVACARNPLLESKFKVGAKFCRTFGFTPLVKYAARMFIAKLMNAFSFFYRPERFFSVKSVCKHFKIQYRYIENINSKEFLQYCRSCDVDIILSVSPTQVFCSELISIPEFGCINVHSSKLPEYRGLYPTYWAMAEGEASVGVTVHYMEKGIDTGGIILQKEVEIPANTTLDAMLVKTKLLGAQMLLEGLELIVSGKVNARMSDLKEGSYYSFPTKESYRDFINNGYRLW